MVWELSLGIRTAKRACCNGHLICHRRHTFCSNRYQLVEAALSTHPQAPTVHEAVCEDLEAVGRVVPSS